MSSSKIIQHFRVAFSQIRKGEEKFYCGNPSEIGVVYTDSQKERINEAQDLYSQAEKLAREVSAEIIGKAIMREF